jgi:hypothetical protein
MKAESVSQSVSQSVYSVWAHTAESAPQDERTENQMMNTQEEQPGSSPSALVTKTNEMPNLRSNSSNCSSAKKLECPIDL